MINSGIYQIRCLINDHIYVGSATYLKKRKNIHNWKLIKNKHENKHLQNAFNLYGESNFVFEILCLVENKERLIDWEQYFIDTLNPEYNINKIAGSSLGNICSKETKIKISNKNSGKRHTEEARLKISLSNKGNKSFWFGKKHTEASKIKMSLSKIGKHSGENNPSSKFTEEIVKEIRYIYEKQNIGIADIVRKYNSKTSTIFNIVHYKTWKDIK